mmetsp:Transcript_17702/g.40137  ORF Transcript_17702/g.40137 Transcript_17702/m.40137 type:complete len:98 (+) Transcript_17702:407-700(+)
MAPFAPTVAFRRSRDSEVRCGHSSFGFVLLFLPHFFGNGGRHFLPFYSFQRRPLRKVITSRAAATYKKTTDLLNAAASFQRAGGGRPPFVASSGEAW